MLLCCWSTLLTACCVTQLRREIAAAMRAVGGLIGRDKMLAYMVLQVKTYHQAVLRDGTGGELGSATAPCQGG